jgi:hypothetical protein
VNVRLYLLFAVHIGCAFISDKHAAWRADPDGDGVAWEDDCEEGNASSSSASEWFEDADGDGYGNADAMRSACSQPEGYVAVTGDCDDADAAVAPGSVDGCNAVDDDCDGLVDEDAAVVDWYLDTDQDGFGDASDVLSACDGPSGRVSNADDCDDDNADAHPNMTEVCDEIDNDCDGQIDEDVADLSVWYRDADVDEHGDPDTSIEACEAPDGYVSAGDDCDDTDAGLWLEGDAEVPYNGVDDNCDSSDGDGDNDLDGYWAIDYLDRVADAGADPLPIPEGYANDCDDADGTVYPGAVDFPYDGIDANCDGKNDYDADGDGFDSDDLDDHVGTDCNDSDPAVYPGAADTWYDGIDSDCGDDSDLDADRDSYDAAEYGGTDCDDTRADIHPGMTETCDTLEDDDCDGDDNDVDADGCTDFFVDVDGDGYGADADSSCICWAEAPYTVDEAGDCADNDSGVNPGMAETWYDGIDADCAGDSDFDADGDGYNASAFDGEDCDDTDDAVHPDAEEVCSDGIDNDCDGLIDSCDPEDADLILTGADDGDVLGSALSAVGNSIAVGAPKHNHGGTDAGALYLVNADLRGAASVTSEITRVLGEGGGGELGFTVLGFTDDDGEDRFAVAAPFLDGLGAVYVISAESGSGSPTALATLSIHADAPGTTFGRSLAVGILGGTADQQLVIGAPGDDPAVWMISLDEDDDIDTSEASASILFSTESMGTAVAVFDGDGDGQDDLLVGGPEYPDGESGIGLVVRYDGPLSGAVDAGDYDHAISGDSILDRFGEVLETVGDIDGDGRVDVAVGAPQNGSTSGGDDPGAVFIVTEWPSGPFDPTEPYAILWGVVAEDWTGGAVTAGDFDGDGEIDLAIGAPGVDAPAGEAGRVYIVLGPIEAGDQELAERADFQINGAGRDDALGTALARLSDTDGDGVDELLVGAPHTGSTTEGSGTAYLFETFADELPSAE